MYKEGLISIIVPVYNIEMVLDRCIESILQQTYKVIEIILIDDGSADDSGYICDKYAQKDRRVKVIHKMNEGAAAARNTGLDYATGEYIGFVDGDDWIRPLMYEKMYDACKRYHVKTAACGIYSAYDTAHFTLIKNTSMEQFFNEEAMLKEILSDGAIGIGVCTKLYHRSIFEKVRFPCQKSNEDAAILLHTIIGWGGLIHIGEPMYYYYFRPDSISNSYNDEKLALLYKNANAIKNKIYELYPAISEYGDTYYFNTLITILKAIVKNKSMNTIAECNYINEFNLTFMKNKNVHLSYKRKILALLLWVYFKLS